MPKIGALIKVERKQNLSGLYGFFLGATKKWALIHEEHDFSLAGIVAVPKRDIKNFRRNSVDRIHEKVFELKRIRPIDGQEFLFEEPRDLLEFLKNKGEMVIVECEKDAEWSFSIGKVQDTNNSTVYIMNFDGEGKFGKKARAINFDEITQIKFLDRYIQGYQTYFDWKQKRSRD